MSYTALYRKFRPDNFEDVKGQDHIVTTLTNQIKASRIGHAYLFCGTRGTGKTTVAKILAKAVNCKHPVNGSPCNECEMCKAIQAGTSMNVIEIDAASNNGVDNIREIREEVAYRPTEGNYKVYIIDEVHMLSTAAFNALLKTLEEPPSHVVFILATTEPQKLPATILSRVQRYDFGRIPSELMVTRMREALADLGMEAEDEALRMVARAAEGAMRDAFSILDMCVAGAEAGTITAARTREMLGASDREFLFDFFDLLRDRDECGVMRKIDQLMRSGREPQVFLRELSGHARCLLTVKAVAEGAASILDVTQEDEARYRKQAEGFSQERLLRVLDGFMRSEGELRFASTPRIGLESAALHACEENREQDASALLERVAELETALAGLRAQLASGVTAAPSAPRSAPVKAEPKPEKPALPPVPKDAREVWDRLLESLKKNDPSLFALLKKERFLGAKDHVYQVLIPADKKEFSYARLNQQARRERIGALLSELTGQAETFEAVLDAAKADPKTEGIRQSAQQSLIETFGRENVQIDEGKTS